MGEGGGAGVRLLLERESQRESPALEPGHRTAHRRVPAPADADVQWLRRPGRVALHRDGPHEVLLIGREPSRPARSEDRGVGDRPGAARCAGVVDRPSRVAQHRRFSVM